MTSSLLTYLDGGGSYSWKGEVNMNLFDGTYTPWEIGQKLLIGDDRIIGSPADDKLHTLGGNDYIVGGPGNDYIDGGSGTDKAIFRVASSNYKVTSNGINKSVQDLRIGSPEGTEMFLRI